MKSIYGMLLVLSLAVVSVPSQGAVVYNYNFDHGYQYGAGWSGGPPEVQVYVPTANTQYYLPGAGEITPVGVWSVLLNWGEYPELSGYGTGNIIDSDGPQGGKAFQVDLGGSWPNKQGLYVGRDEGGAAADGSYATYGYVTYPGYPGTMPGCSVGSTISDNYTIEAIVKTDFSANPAINFGQTQRSTIYDSIREDKTDGAALWVDQTNGNVGFAMGDGTSLTVAAGLVSGAWYDIKAVVNSGLGIQVYVDGTLKGTGAYTTGTTSLPGYFTLATCYSSSNSQNWQGLIDNFTITSDATVPEPTSIVTLAAGLLGACGAILRRSGR